MFLFFWFIYEHTIWNFISTKDLQSWVIRIVWQIMWLLTTYPNTFFYVCRDALQLAPLWVHLAIEAKIRLSYYKAMAKKCNNSIWSYCCNPNLGLATKARVYKVAGQEGSQESHNILSGVWEGVREWTLTPQGSSTLGVNLQRAIARVKTQWLEEFFISMEISWNVDI